jgi:serine O-acetyltransferase
VKYSIQIPISVQIGEGLLLPHFGGIVINSKSAIGNNCNILQNVTLGNTKRGQKKGAPLIGNNVYIGPSATVVGGITVGNNVLIVANSFVNFDVPNDSIVIGNPAKIISRENAVDGYINNTYNAKK